MAVQSKYPGDDTMLALIAAGKSLKGIAEATGVARSTVERWLAENNLATLHKARPRPPSQQAIARTEKIRAMRAAGSTVYQIHIGLGVKYQHIKAAIKDMPEPTEKPVVVKRLPRTKPTAKAYFFANPFRQAVGNVAEGHGKNFADSSLSTPLN